MGSERGKVEENQGTHPLNGKGVAQVIATLQSEPPWGVKRVPKELHL